MRDPTLGSTEEEVMTLIRVTDIQAPASPAGRRVHRPEGRRRRRETYVSRVGPALGGGATCAPNGALVQWRTLVAPAENYKPQRDDSRKEDS
jgi:hypothetical protein